MSFKSLSANQSMHGKPGTETTGIPATVASAPVTPDDVQTVVHPMVDPGPTPAETTT